MAVRKDDRPYLALGQLLESWRRTKFRSALALFKATKFSFSYAAYADFERGVTLPSIDAIVELAHFLKQEPSQAALLWARLQMPTKQLQELFLFERRKRARDVPAPATEEKSPAPSFENTWVFGPRERALLLKHPWFWDVCMV
ncbi:MAG: hypothetical protein ACXWP5_05230, partial [Bdellovibrionota bacterium]